jgi:integrase/recombinase XerD
MIQLVLIEDRKEYRRLQQVQKRLIEAGNNPRDQAFIAVQERDGLSISEATQLKETNIDFERGSLNIVHLKERLKLKCPGCGEILGKRHVFCPGCGKKVDDAIREKAEQQRQRTIPADHYTLQLLEKYLQWRRQFPYRGPLVFPFSRQRGWQLVRKIGRRAGIDSLHPSILRHLFATAWVAKGLDVKKLHVLLGYASIAAATEHVDYKFDQLKSEHQKLWQEEGEENESTD